MAEDRTQAKHRGTLQTPLNGMLWATAEGLLSHLVKRRWWSGKAPREPRSIFMIQEVSPNGNRNDEHFMFSHSILYSASVRPVSLSHRQERKLKHREINSLSQSHSWSAMKMSDKS